MSITVSINRRIVIAGSLMLLALSSLSAESEARQTARALQNAFREVANEVLPVVVQVNRVDIMKQQSNPFNFFFHFPGFPEQPETPENSRPFKALGYGSGVLVERRNNTVYVLTNNHVVKDAEELTVKLNDGREFTAQIVGGDSLRDLALVSFNTKEDIPLAELGNSDEVQVGDWVIAIGSPLGLQSTVTSGIISAKGRETQNESTLSDYLQTDASINQGNSGGALVNIDGKVIGINSFIKTNSGGSVGLGFAIPINNARKAITDFIEKGSVQYAWLGVYMIDLNKTLADELNLKDVQGAFIYSTLANSPAVKSGIQPGDVIVTLAGRTIKDSGDLTRAVIMQSPGQMVPVELLRDNRTINLNITLAEKDTDKNKKNKIWPGFSVVSITAEIRKQLDISRFTGKVIIGAVIKNSAAANLGLRNGDVVKSINGRNVKSVQHFYTLINSSEKLEIKILRKGQTLEYILRK